PTARGWNAPPSRSGPTSLSSTCDSATGFNGLTVARRLKRAEDFPLLFLTSASSIEDVPGRLRRRRRRLHRQAVRDGRDAGPDARRAAPQRPGDLNVVEVHVSALRKKLEEHGPRIIQTVRGVGYVLRP